MSFFTLTPAPATRADSLFLALLYEEEAAIMLQRARSRQPLDWGLVAEARALEHRARILRGVLPEPDPLSPREEAERDGWEDPATEGEK